MTFNSLQYAIFLPVVLFVYFRLRSGRAQNGLIFVAGSIFYGLFDWRFLGLLYLSIAVDYLVGRGLAGTDRARTRKQLVVVSLVVQLGILAVFKYFDFFSDSFADLFDIFGIRADPFTLDVVLPVGISFYTFQSLNYVFAVYRRQLEAEEDIVTFAAFVAWFPQLVAGPIERAPSLLGQIRQRREAPDWARTETALLLILRGLFKKVVIADSVAPYINDVYANPAAHRWSALVLATVGFGVQVYGDFSGYSDIARGSSRLLGVELRRNFEQPFLSRSMREFWLRWHTSLGAWFVENVAQPLGAGRSRARAMAVVLLMFGLIGLWHGAAWPFVIWGLYNGVLVASARLLPPPRSHPMRLSWVDVPKIAFTFGLFCIGIVFFRSASFSDAADVFSGILSRQGGRAGPGTAALVPLMLAAVLALDLLERFSRIRTIETLRVRANLGDVASRREAQMESVIPRPGPVAIGALVGVLLVGVVVFSGGTPTPFIYFQF